MAGSSDLPPDGQQSTDVCADELIMLRHQLAEKAQTQSNNEKLIRQLFHMQD